jgi:hypothetical protein
MTETNAPHEPNEFGFAGAGTAPEPTPDDPASEPDEGPIAVPAGDLTEAISDAIADATTSDDES